MGTEAELRRQFLVWLENCRLRLAVVDSRERLRAEMVALAGLLVTPHSSSSPPRTVRGEEHES